jgi:hypothetical protein
MYNIGSIVSVKGVTSPVTITDIIHAGGLVGYAGTHITNGITMTISWIPSALTRPL